MEREPTIQVTGFMRGKTIEFQDKSGHKSPEDQIFEVADPLFWTDCADECLANEWFYFNFQCMPLE